MKLDFEYGHGTMTAELPDTTDVFIPGETIPDPPCIPEDQIVAKTRESIRNPMGMKPLSELAHKGSKVVIVIPDIVKGALSFLNFKISLDFSSLKCYHRPMLQETELHENKSRQWSRSPVPFV